MKLDPAFLLVLKELGDGAIHPNDGDVDQQAKLDNALLSKMKATFQMVLDLVCEEPRRTAQRLADLKGAAQDLKGPS